jgi:dihydroorotase
VGVHHLHLCDRDAADFNANMNLVPPLRDGRDRDALRRALADGTVDAVCSDHTPVDDDAKQVPFGEAEPGATGLEVFLPLLLKWGSEMKIPLPATLAAATSRAAAVLGIDAGALSPGRPADICLFDPQAHWTVTAAALASQGRNSPFLGLELVGRATLTIVDGRVVWPA